MYDIEDDYDFSPSDSSKLTSLFGSPTVQTDESTNNLMYTAPKQPSTTKNSIKSPSTATKVMLIKIVSLWKSENNEYKPLGKHGLAIIGAVDLKAYEVIAYKHKTNTILRAKVDKEFAFHKRKDNFSSFNDTSNQNWLVKFDNNQQLVEFADHLNLLGATIVSEPVESKKDEKSIPKPDILPKPDVSTNDHDSDSSDSTKKATILCRITKMGQQIVPKPVLESDISDEFESKENKTKKFRKIKKFEKEEEHHHIPVPSSNQMVPKSVVSIPQVPVYYSHTYGDFSSILLAQNSELKSSLSQISEKLENLCIPKKESGNLNSKLKVLELKSENLQTELDRYKEKYSELKSKYLEKIKSEIAEHEKTTEVLHLKTRVKELATELQEAKNELSNLNHLQQELEKNKKDIDEYQRIIETQKISLEELDLFYQQYKNAEKTENKLSELESTVKDLNKKLYNYEIQIEEYKLEKDKTHLHDEKNVNDLTDLIKMHMNGMYQSILNAVDHEEAYNFRDIQGLLSKKLKETSFQMINDIKKKLQEKTEDT